MAETYTGIIRLADGVQGAHKNPAKPGATAVHVWGQEIHMQGQLLQEDLLASTMPSSSTSYMFIAADQHQYNWYACPTEMTRSLADVRMVCIAGRGGRNVVKDKDEHNAAKYEIISSGLPAAG